MGFAAPQHVEGQPRAGLPFGLFSVLSLRASEDPHWANGIEWEAMTCAPVTALADPDCETPVELHFDDTAAIGAAEPFVVYGSAKCGTPGGRPDLDGEERATAHLLAREEAQAEALLWGRALAPVATDVGPSTALPPEQALAVLEGWLGAVYGSLGVVHGSRTAASLLGSDAGVQSSGSRLLTRLGTPVVAGAGYPGSGPGGTPAADGEEWLFASPSLFGYRGSVFTTTTLDTRNNDHYALAGRQYAIGFDPCGVAAVRMTTV